MFSWKKLGKIFDPKDLPIAGWMHEFAQSPSVVVGAAVVRVYFCSRPPPDSNGLYRSYIGYIDLDRGDLRRVLKVCGQPVLSLGRHGTFDEFGTYPVSVIRDGDKIRAYYAGVQRCESVPFNAAIGVAVSCDGGETFQRLGEGPVLSYTADEPFLLGSPRVRRFNGRWQIWYAAGREYRMVEGKPEPVYKIRMAISDDGVTWIKEGRDLLSDKLGSHECQACADVTYRNGRYHMFFSYRDIRNYKTREGGYRIGYASSSDMLHWLRNDDLVDIRPSESGWDSEMVNYPHLFELDGATYMLYQGNGMGRTGFGLAVLKSEDAWSQA